MEAKMSVLELIMSFPPYLRSAMVGFPFNVIDVLKQYFFFLYINCILLFKRYVVYSMP